MFTGIVQGVCPVVSCEIHAGIARVAVDLDDLADSIEMGVIAGAGLDVFEVEPLPLNHPLWRMENVIVTPHVAGASPRIAERHLNILIENVKRFIDDRPLRNIVDKSRWF